MKKTIASLISTSLGSGYAPVGPGTFGTVFGLIIYMLLVDGFYDADAGIPQFIDWILIVLILVFTWLGTWAAGVMEPDWGHDPGKIVMDETVGVWITVLFIPYSWVNVIIAFVLFRFFDILKPFGIRTIDEKMITPFAVYLDDILAGVYAAITMQLVIYFFNT